MWITHTHTHTHSQKNIQPSNEAHVISLVTLFEQFHSDSVISFTTDHHKVAIKQQYGKFKIKKQKIVKKYRCADSTLSYRSIG